MNRREFVQTAGAGSAALAMVASGFPLVAGPFLRDQQSDHFVPADKQLTREWLDALFAKGEPVWYQGDDLDTIGMPVGGICAGQLYLTGDGRLVYWEIFNENRNTGYGAVNYLDRRTAEQTVEGGKVVPAPDVAQGHAIRVRFGGNTVERTLDRNGFPGARFCGEYPIGRVRYEDGSLPVTIDLEAFSPFIPLDAADSALPATVLRYTVTNTSRAVAGEPRLPLHRAGIRPATPPAQRRAPDPRHDRDRVHRRAGVGAVRAGAPSHRARGLRGRRLR